MSGLEPTTELQEIFEAEDGFLLRLRTELIWDKALFKSLVQAMQQYLETTESSDCIARWAAYGFWFTETFTKDWISHPSFPKSFSADYYEAALERLHELSYWLFFGESPMESGTLAPFDAE
jgi:hypothetical protein